MCGLEKTVVCKVGGVPLNHIHTPEHRELYYISDGGGPAVFLGTVGSTSLSLINVNYCCCFRPKLFIP